jgi:hypothetical protein
MVCSIAQAETAGPCATNPEFMVFGKECSGAEPAYAQTKPQSTKCDLSMVTGPLTEKVWRPTLSASAAHTLSSPC